MVLIYPTLYYHTVRPSQKNLTRHELNHSQKSCLKRVRDNKKRESSDYGPKASLDRRASKAPASVSELVCQDGFSKYPPPFNPQHLPPLPPLLSQFSGGFMVSALPTRGPLPLPLGGCRVMEQKEIPNGFRDEACGKETPAGHAGLCQ